ncbi:MAG: ABC transporter permease [Anaerolineae bacterium]|nr:ABC transporter permease [Anaerolineae bacterium]
MTKDKIKQDLINLFPFVVVGILWEVIVQLGLSGIKTLPAPSDIFRSAWSLIWGSNVLFHHLLSSLYRITVGYLLAVTLGIAVGVLLSLNKTLHMIFSPVISLLISVPTLAWVPVLLVIMGLGDRTVIMTIFLGGFFAIAYNTMSGIEMVNQNQIHAAEIVGVKGLRLVFSVLIPGSLVSIIAGLRLGIGYSWRALVGGEMLAAMIQWGVGKMIYQARFFNDTAVMFVGLILIGISSTIIDQLLLRRLERWTIEKWGVVAEN